MKDMIAKFGFKLKISKLHLYMIKYRVDANYSLWGVFMKAETFFDILNAKT